MAGASVKVDGSEVRALFQRLTERVRNPRPVLEDAASRLLRIHTRARDTQSSPEGVPWPSLSLRYARRKLARFGPRKKLVARGTLMRSVHSGLLEGNRGVFISTGELPYARIHQFGGQAGRGRKTRIPARPYLPSNELAERTVAESLEDALAEAGEGK